MTEPAVSSEQEFLTAAQTSKWLGVSLKSIYNWRLQRRLPVVKMGRLVRYSRIELRKRLLTGQLLIEKSTRST